MPIGTSGHERVIARRTNIRFFPAAIEQMGYMRGTATYTGAALDEARGYIETAKSSNRLLAFLITDGFAHDWYSNSPPVVASEIRQLVRIYELIFK